jgi:glycosyltransferase involved in cell wall biosynthesis
MTADPRILCIDDMVPQRRFGAGYPRAEALLKLLASGGFRVTLFPYKTGRAERPALADFRQRGIQVVQYAGPAAEVLARFCAAKLGGFDAVWISRPENFRRAFPVVRAQRTHQAVIYDAEALRSVRRIARRDVVGDPPDSLERFSIMAREFAMMRHADAITSVSEPERALIARICGKPTFLLGNPQAVTPTPRDFAERSDLLFVGAFHQSNCPNTDSMLYFAREVLPLIRRQVACRLHVFGFRSETLRAEKWLRDDPAVVVHGAVDSLMGAYDSARVMVVPTRFAAGVPGKLTEAFAHGLPCVATPLIAKQVPFREPPVLRGADAPEFAARVISLYTDEALWRRMRRIGLEYARMHCDERAIQAQIDALRTWTVRRRAE